MLISRSRRAKLEKLMPDAMEHYERIAASEPQPNYIIDADRASGTCDCFVCGIALYDHPPFPHLDDSTTVIDCEGRIWKL